ncbi:MAG: YbhB/YbcL family Raf kinase inhibitor-like protein [Phycisphaerae bacterium]|nr:YbhB/YbcL family Raf kinase inhibitor-like protein [Phycisphaerae bacterium]
MRLLSPAFAEHDPIPKKYTQDGANISPPLVAVDLPRGVREYALVMDDLGSPQRQPRVHWVIYKIPPEVHELPENIARREVPPRPVGARQGLNSWRHNVGYRGPAPPPGDGVHHYLFTLFALDAPVYLASGVSKGALLNAIRGHVLAQASLIGTYKR